MQIILLFNTISSAINPKKCSFKTGKILIKTGILLNLSKAFDTVDNNILFIKLKDYRLFGSISHGLKVTLQKENKLGSAYNGHRSVSKRIGCGVAQDAISGPLLVFPTHTNYLCNVSKVLEFMMALMYI